MVLTNVYVPAILARSAVQQLTANRGHFVLMVDHPGADSVTPDGNSPVH
ncbi:UNVERIFIED_ORG: hypothetical protein ABIB19_003238 [Arthrobacter sp. UYEF10]